MKIKSVKEAQAATGLCLDFKKAEVVISELDLASDPTESKIDLFLKGKMSDTVIDRDGGWVKDEENSYAGFLVANFYTSDNFLSWGAMYRNFELKALRMRGWLAVNEAVFVSNSGEVFYRNSINWLKFKKYL